MFFFLSKLLDVALDPLWWGLVALAVSLAIRGRKPRASMALAGAGLAVLLVFSLPAVSERLWFGLEHEAPNTFRPGVVYDAVVLLGGVVDASGSTPEQAAYGNNVDRLTTVFDLLRAGTAKQVIVSGGVLAPGLPTEGAYLKRQLIAWGVEPERIVVDEKAKNTRENAMFVAELARSNALASVLVVTSAFHMQRAAGCFRAAGLPVDVLPVDFRLRDLARNPSWVPRADDLADSTKALREYSGRVVYSVMGYSQ